ncbi:MAG: copper oxidase [Pseudomonadota bacterium]
MKRRDLLKAGILSLAGGSLFKGSRVLAREKDQVTAQPGSNPHTPVVTPNGTTLPWLIENGFKVFRLVTEPVKREFAPGMIVNCWGYNGQTPGPTIEAIEGDHLRILITNKLPEPTTIHWHGLYVPSGMDGVGGLSHRHIPPGKTYVYEFTLRQSGTFMYHPHSDENLQLALGMMGMIVAHPKRPEQPKIGRDYCIMLHAWDVDPGSYTPKPATMTDFNLWSFNSRVFPGTAPLVARTGDRVRIRIGNLSMHDHPLHVHGFSMTVTGTDGGWVPVSVRWPESSVNVPVGTVRTVEFVADEPGDWAFHCHKSHHTMNPMGHAIPNMVGVDQRGVTERINRLLPEYMAMGSKGMADMTKMQEMGMPLPENTLPMMTGKGPFGPLEMGGMFTVVKVRDDLAPKDYQDPGWYRNPKGTVAYELRKGS